MFITFTSKKRLTTNIIFSIVITIFLFYIIYYSYNTSRDKTQNLTSSDISIKCISNVCITYDNIKECIHIEVPTTFRIESTEDINFLRTDVKNIDFISIKEDCR